MKDEHFQENTTNTNQTNMAPVVYAYPPGVIRDDEIDLSEFLSSLMQQWRIMLAILLVGTVLSFVITITLPETYEVETILSSPQEAQLSQLNTNGYVQYSPQVIFNRYYDYLRSEIKLEEFILEQSYLTRLYPDAESSEKRLLPSFFYSFSISILEPLPEDREGIILNPNRLSLKVLHQQELASAELINHFVGYSAKQLLSEIKNEQKSVIRDKIIVTERDIAMMRAKAKMDREAEIERLENDIQKKISVINADIAALEKKAIVAKDNTIADLEEANALAKKLNIENPTYLSELSKNNDPGPAMAEIKLSEDQELPLYLMGTTYLTAKIDQLRNRKTEVPYIDEMAELRRQLSLLENNSALEALKNRKSDDPYISGLTEKLNFVAQLKNYTLDFDAVDIFRLEKSAAATGIPVKPNKRLVLLLGVLVSLLASFFVGVLCLMVKKIK